MTEDHANCMLAIVGSRDVPDYQAASLVKQAILEHKPRMVISGGARGIDTLAVTIAREMGVPTIEFQPTVRSWDALDETKDPWEEVTETGMVVHVPGGYKQRNEKVAASCDCLMRIASHTTKTYGSGWTADRAEALGKHVVRHTV